MTEPRELGSAALVRLVAGREISARLRDKNFIISSIVIIVVLLGVLGLQVALNSGDDVTQVGVVGEQAGLSAALEAQATALGADVEVDGLRRREAARAPPSRTATSTARCRPRRPAAAARRGHPRAARCRRVVQGAVAQLAVAEQLADAGDHRLDVPAGDGHRARPERRRRRPAGRRRDHRRRHALRPADPVRAVRRPGRRRGEVEPGGRAAAGDHEAVAAAGRQDRRPRRCSGSAQIVRHRRRRRRPARSPSTSSTSPAS